VTSNSSLGEIGRLDALYSEPIPARRTGPLYNAFSYPTKIDPEAIALFIATHTSPGDTVLDVFAGSGTTGLAARLCDNPTEAMKRRARELALHVKWGPRTAILYELSVVGSLLAQTMCHPPQASDFAASANAVVERAEDQFGWMYAAEGPDGTAGAMRHAIWSEVLLCSSCGTRVPFWDLAVTRKPLALLRRPQCQSCGHEIPTSTADRATHIESDPLMGDQILQRVRQLAYIYGRTGRTAWQRPPVASDSAVVDRVLQQAIPTWVPSTPIRWGDLYRSGYHQGIDRIHHFYTRRNLIALGALWDEIEREPEHLRDALRLLVLSYNAAHSTLMTRVVVKTGISDFVLTGAQSGVLYVSSLPVEKNVFTGVSRKIKTFKAAFTLSAAGSSDVRVVNASSAVLDLPDRSIDYVFTDPPFGGFIPYAEINQINEAWLGSLTDTSAEAIISPAQGKGVADYARMIGSVFSEVGRVMKEDALATVVFHSSQPDVWSGLDQAFQAGGLVVRGTSVLDKKQVSFKQAVSDGSTRGDAIFLLSKGCRPSTGVPDRDLGARIIDLRDKYGGDLSPQHLYSRYVAQSVADGRPVEMTSNVFYTALHAVDTTV
jgi:16S rRNA G966 N2-methylase RsmD